MGKKHKKKKDKNRQPDIFKGINMASRKKMNAKFRSILDEIEDYRVKLYESDKKASKSRKTRKAINKEEASFFLEMDSIKCRKKISKKWEDTGFMDQMADLLKEVSPFVQLLARALATLITLFLSIPAIKHHISPDMLSKLTTVFDIAMAM